jgi:rubrerythrin
MGFFDKFKETASAVGGKVKETGVAIGDKSKIAIEKQKIKGAISKENQNITKQYTEIGKKYVELYYEQASLEFADNIKAINTSKEEITKLSVQLNDLEDYTTCQCGTRVPKNAGFCPNCGNAIVVTTATTAEEVVTEVVPEAEPVEDTTQPVEPADAVIGEDDNF